MDDEDIDIEQHESAPKPPLLLPPPLIVKSQADERKILAGNDSTRQIRYYQDRIDFHGDILMKPKAAKSMIC